MTFGHWISRISVCFWACHIGIGSAVAADLHGVGATFPEPIYAAWAEKYKREAGVEIEYLPTGSAAGLAVLEQGRVDFGGADFSLAPAELARLALRQFPTVVGGVVPVLNITGITPGRLRLTGGMLAAIYLGSVRKWNDAAIVALNPGLDLPDANITVVHRSDGSGTTRAWSEFLSASSDEWRTRIGSASTLLWPTGVAETGNEGVASTVQRTRFAIGYVGYAYALQHGLSVASLRNRDGRFVVPSTTAFEAAASASDDCAGSGVGTGLVDRPGSGSWPITIVSFILMPKKLQESPRSTQVLAFFDWALKGQARMAIDLGYVPAPEAIRCVPR